MKLSDLMSRYAPAYLDDWHNAFAGMLTSSAEADRIEVLRADLRRCGKLRRAVRIDSEQMRVSDGMHRIAAHYLEGAQDIATEEESESCSYYPDIIELVFRVPDVDLEDDDSSDEVMEALSSFPIGDYGWGQCDSMGWTPESMNGWYYWYRDRIDELTDAFCHQAQKFGIRVQDVSAQWIPDEE